ncbi:MAG: inositol monophosphatase family protein [Acidimicrobiia bacterium]
MNDVARLLDVGLEAARAASMIVLDGAGNALDVRSKGQGDWVSEIDERAELAVREVFAKHTPHIPVFGEEGGGALGEEVWCVDPLDGTSNFLHGLPAVGVSIALIRDGSPVVAVVDAPFLRTTWTATLGGGAFQDDQRISVSNQPMQRAIVATGFPFRRPELRAPYLEIFKDVIEAVEDVRRCGAASLDLCWTASGVFDGYFELALSPWDVAAGGLIVREAGGVVTDWWGSATPWLESGNIVAANPSVFSGLIVHTEGFPQKLV